MATWLKDKWKAWLGFILIAAAVWLVNHYLGTNIPEPSPPSFGWLPRPAEVEAVASTLRFKVFADTPAGQTADPLPSQFYLWEVYRKVDPNGPPSKNQGQVGCCVSFGTNNAILRSMAAGIVVNQQPFELRDIVEEVTYAGSRVEIGGGRISGDGSVGAWAAQFVQKYGVLARGKYTAGGQTYDLTTYSETRARSWGRSGVPDALEPTVREHPVQEITQVKTWAEAKRALSQGYGIAVCSNQGFSMTRDANGVCRPSGSWAHCMCLDGFHTDAGHEYGHIENSWGADAFRGPVGWGNPPASGFWADSSVVDRMLKANDSWAFSGVKGFPARKLDWLVEGTPRPTRRIAYATDSRTAAVLPALLLLCP